MGHTRKEPNLLAEHVFSMLNGALIKPERSLNFWRARAIAARKRYGTETFPPGATSVEKPVNPSRFREIFETIVTDWQHARHLESTAT
jgi:hypothetical protein